MVSGIRVSFGLFNLLVKYLINKYQNNARITISDTATVSTLFSNLFYLFVQ